MSDQPERTYAIYLTIKSRQVLDGDEYTGVEPEEETGDQYVLELTREQYDNANFDLAAERLAQELDSFKSSYFDLDEDD